MSHSDAGLRAVVFDFGGVLLDWNPRHLYRRLFPDDDAAMELFLEAVGFTDWNIQQDLGRPFSVAVAEQSARFPEYADLIGAYHVRWEESIAGPIQATVDLLAPLKEAGYELHGLSNWSAETFALSRARYGFFDLFDTIVISGQERVIKPDARIFEILLERTGRAANECLFVDDSRANVAAARDLGFEAFHFTSAGDLASDLRRRGLL